MSNKEISSGSQSIANGNIGVLPKKKKRVKKLILLLLLFSIFVAGIWYFAVPIREYGSRVVYDNQWRFVPGKAENEKEIKVLLDGFAGALEKKDSVGAAQFVHPVKAAGYQKMFRAKPEGIVELALAIRSVKEIKMTGELKLSGVRGRIADVTVIYHNGEFDIQLQKINDKWYVSNI